MMMSDSVKRPGYGRTILAVAVALVLLLGGFLATMLLVPEQSMPGILQSAQSSVKSLAVTIAGQPVPVYEMPAKHQNADAPTASYDETEAEDEDYVEEEEYDETDGEEGWEAVATETPAPVAEPFTAATIAPTAEPTPEPTAQPALQAGPVDKTQPSSMLKETVIYENSKKIKSYSRPTANILKMAGGRDYTTLPNGKEFGVFTFRGNAFRANAAVGNVSEDTASLTQKWAYETVGKGLVFGKKTLTGIGWTGQPAIIKWSREVREKTNIVEDKRDTVGLKEVIVAGQDGYIYYLDLADGQPTREAFNVGFPMYGTPSIHSLGYPLMTVGQYTAKVKGADKKAVNGLRYYNLYTQEQIYIQDGLDGKLKRPYNTVGSFNTSALFDKNTDTMVTIGTNGMLYVTKLNTQFDYSIGSIYVDPSSVTMKSKTGKQKNAGTAVESSAAMYGSYVYYADIAGYLHCVDTTTMTNVWMTKLNDKVEAAISLDFDSDGTLWVYVATEYANRGKNGGEINISRYNAMNGTLGWTLPVNVRREKKSEIVSGVRASGVMGEHEIDDLVIYTVSSLGKDPMINIQGAPEDGPALGCVVAVRKADGQVAWARAIDSYAYSSPVAVYSESGRSWIVQAASSGNIYLLDGKTGTVVDTLKVDGTIEASPAVFGSTMVIGTTGSGTNHIYGITIE